MDGKFSFTSEDPNLDLTAVNPTGTRWRDNDDVKVEVTLWFRQADQITDPWQKLPDTVLRKKRDSVDRSSDSSTFADEEDSFGSATLWLSADDNEIFRNGVRYEFELRSQCSAIEDGEERMVGEMRSGPRLGIVDMQGPQIISWKMTQTVNKPTLGFPICSILFDEAIDCSHPSLEATITTRDGNVHETKDAGVYCTGRLQQLNVVLQLDPDEDDVDVWSGTNVDVSITGIRDIFGNLYGVDGALSGRRKLRPHLRRHLVLDEIMTIIPMNFTLPSIPNFTGTERPWVMPNQESVNSTVETERNRFLPRGMVLPSSHSFKEFDPKSGPTLSPTSTPTLSPKNAPTDSPDSVASKTMVKFHSVQVGMTALSAVLLLVF